ncbi:polysaccharide deacetylase family protein [Leadbettera azotonutricia]|uniref:polysaccharide deacetylase family protein n=1 Tax=Leadbettera azotonutricia TaxID=150829 RepID=UPI00145DE3B9|nr:polysaccharide deacetylase family protein [Leadbettera azotonutricia]
MNFSALDLSADNRLLFKANSAGSGAAAQSALFIARLPDPALQQLSSFPEKMDLIDNGRMLQIRNAFGCSRLPISGGLPRQIPGFPSFAGGSPASSGRVEDMAVSADGRFLLYIDPVSAAYGNLVMLDASSGAKITVALHVERPDRIFPASWSPDSRVFVYARGGKLYYYTVNPASAPVDEKFRFIGEGTVNSVYWGRGGDFFYLRASTIYRVRAAELFARALYAGFLEIGTVAGKIPFEFSPGFDSFWIAPDARSLILSKGGRNIFYIPLDFDDYEGSGDASLPYLAVPRACLSLQVLWPSGGAITILASLPAQKTGEPPTLAWRLQGHAFVPLSAPLGSSASLSPDGTKALAWGSGGIALYDYINWKILDTISTRPAYSCVWIGNDDFAIGDDQRIERIRLGSGNSASTAGIARRDLICLSQISRFGFEDKVSGDAQPRILAQNGSSWYTTDCRSPWAEIPNPQLRAVSQVSSRYRVYLDRQSGGPYENLPMIRNIASVGTASLLPVTDRQGGLRELGLCFDLYDDAEGLPEALDALNRFGIKATFFLGGEFIRRYPAAAADIVASGHETASLFFAPIDLSDARYRIGSDFISRGLARNEDEFYRATGSELALLWHPPYYAASPEVSSAAAQAGYTTIVRSIDPLDWVSREDEIRFSLPQYSASDMVDRIMEAKKPGALVPIRLGLLPGGRVDYLFNRLNVLLDALMQEGYTVVKVSTLLEHGKE